MPLTEADWNAARDDAGLSADEDSVWRLPGVPPGGEAEARAVWIPPEEQVKSTHRFPLGADLVQSLNSPEAIARYRVLAFDEVDKELIFGYVRHELEHVLQHREFPPAIWLSQRTCSDRPGRRRRRRTGMPTDEIGGAARSQLATTEAKRRTGP
jgi:hypothetical protein